MKSKVGLEHVAACVWGFSERTDVDGACDWPAARLAGGQVGLCTLRDGISPEGLVRKGEEPWRKQHPQGSWKAHPIKTT